MEDAHFACPAVVDDAKEEAPVSLFGVFDGHGGKEVSAFVKLKYIEVLVQLPSFQEGRYRDALRESFHKIDELLEEEQFEALLKQLRAMPNPSDSRKVNNSPHTNNSLGNHSSSLTTEVLQSMASQTRDSNNVGSIIQPLTAPDRSASPESDDGDDANSPLPHGKGGDIDSMTIIKQLLEGAKQYSRAKSRNDSEAIAAAAASVAGNLRTLQAARAANNHAAPSPTPANDNSEQGSTPSSHAEDIENATSKPQAAISRVDDGDDADVENNLERDSEDSLDHDFVRHHIERDLSESSAPLSETSTIVTSISIGANDSSTQSYSASTPMVKDEATDSDASSSSDPEDAVLAASRSAPITKPIVVIESNQIANSDNQKPSPPKSPSKVNNNPFKGETYQTVFSERVNEDVVNANDDEPDSQSAPIPSATPPSLQSSNITDSDLPAECEEMERWMNEDSSSDEDISPPKASNRLRAQDIDSTESNQGSETSESAIPVGRPPAPANFTTYKTTGNTHVCQLKDHKVLAGCTAIVALLVGEKYMLVANAGDSRGVLCRKGVAVALSEDHKPSQEREIRRIKNAGGFVNMVGRVNGNLNLSRSLGDLKYKQVKHLPPEEQMITAEPDIELFEIHPEEDEFFILACDGIWDVLTNQEACDFVRQKVFEEHLSLDEVVQAVMKRCLAKDPRASQGVGGDNMTFMVVWLQKASMPSVSRVAAEPESSATSIPEEKNSSINALQSREHNVAEAARENALL
jgi:serine/threonine protein phosphatase PrpC